MYTFINRVKSYIITLILIGNIIASKTDDEDNSIIKQLPVKYDDFIKSTFKGMRTSVNTPCTCGIFLDGQLSNNDNVLPDENPVFSKEMDLPMYPCGIHGNKNCMKKCIETIINYIPSIGPLICASIDRDCMKERAQLYTKNCDNNWRSTGFTPGKEFCCVDGMETKCKLGMIQQKLKTGLFTTSTLSKSIPDILLDLANRATDIASSVLSFKV